MNYQNDICFETIVISFAYQASNFYFEEILEFIDVDLMLLVYLTNDHQKYIFGNAYLIFCVLKYLRDHVILSLFLICLIGFKLVQNWNKTHILRSAIQQFHQKWSSKWLRGDFKWQDLHFNWQRFTFDFKYRIHNQDKKGLLNSKISQFH